MSAEIFRVFETQQNTLGVARQEYILARMNYRDVCREFDARLPESQGAFRAAVDRRQSAFERYIRVLAHDDPPIE